MTRVGYKSRQRGLKNKSCLLRLVYLLPCMWFWLWSKLYVDRELDSFFIGLIFSVPSPAYLIYIFRILSYFVGITKTYFQTSAENLAYSILVINQDYPPVFSFSLRFFGVVKKKLAIGNGFVFVDCNNKPIYYRQHSYTQLSLGQTKMIVTLRVFNFMFTKHVARLKNAF